MFRKRLSLVENSSLRMCVCVCESEKRDRGRQRKGVDDSLSRDWRRIERKYVFDRNLSAWVRMYVWVGATVVGRRKG